MNWPWSIIAGLAYLYILAVLYVLSDNRPALRKLWGGPVCIISISFLLLGCLLLGLGIISSPTNPAITIPAFVMITATGLTCADEFRMLLHPSSSERAEISTLPRLKHFPPVLLGRMLSHLGLFLWMSAAVFGTADTEKIDVECHLEQESVTGRTANGKEVMLPFGITLHKFAMQEYPGKICIVDDNGNIVENSGWKTAVTCRLENSWPADGDSIVELKHLGAVQAAFVRAECGTDIREGWICHGSFMLDARNLDLGDGLHAVMASPAAKDYLSQITVEGVGNRKDFNLRVNHPATTGKWKLYQSGYDAARGKWSTSSTILCVRDPWRNIKTAALWILLAGGLLMLVSGSLAKKKSADKTGSMTTGLVAAALLAFTYLIIFRHNLHKDLPPALQSWWYVPHVASYITAYSLLAAATILSLWPRTDFSATIAKLVKAGWGLLTMGLTMGALWASEAWGDFWTWDPKETWAAATWLCYLIYMHLPRIFARISGQYGDRTYRNLRTAVLIASFLLLQMSWWGVKLIAHSGSLHLY